MAYEQRPNDGSLFRNKEMRADRKDPNLTGKIMLPDGTLHWFKAWTKESAAGEKWLSCQIGDPVNGQAVRAAPVMASDDSDIPF
jgi:uncharacterized protein (DUF736 family)